MQLSLNTLTALTAAGDKQAQKAIDQWIKSIHNYDARVYYHAAFDTLEVLPRERIAPHGE
jgi:predicted NBD/HSP70 family sugar kinase